MDREAALAGFEVARGEWANALERVPDDALAYLKPGDDYALGGLQVHVNWVLLHYRRVLEGIVARKFERLEPQDRPGEEAASREAARQGLDGAGRRHALDEMAGHHEGVLRTLNKVSAADWDRKAPVVYVAGQEPYPTSPADLIDWLTGHYREHVQQAADLTEEWRAAKAAG